MLLNALVAVTILKVAAGEAAADSQPHQQLKHAISSQSYVRHDVPLSYKYSSVHVYSTVKPEPEQHYPVTPSYYPLRTNNKPELQYAPIVRDNEVRNSHNAVADAPQNHESVVEINKHNLEPKFPNRQELSYVPGYNIELMQSANRYPAHNAIYRSYPNIAVNDKLHKTNYLNQFIFHPKLEENDPLRYVETTQQSPAPIFEFVPKQYLQSTTTYRPIQDYQIATVNLQPLYPPHPKTHRVLLNVARAYNIANLRHKGQHNPNKSGPNAPTHTQVIFKIPNQQQVNTEIKTQLNPLEKRYHSALRQYS